MNKQWVEPDIRDNVVEFVSTIRIKADINLNEILKMMVLPLMLWVKIKTAMKKGSVKSFV